MRRTRLHVTRLFRCPSLVLVLLPLLLLADPATLRFAWLSDTHVGGPTGAEDLRASVHDINSMTGLAFVIVSGDVTEYGSLEQFKLAKDILGELRFPAHVIPGNHDTKWSESGGTDFPRLWGGDRFAFEAAGFRFVGLHEGPVMRMGDGHFAPQDVRWLDSVLKERTDKPLIFVTHYPLNESIANGYVVLDRLKQHQARIVLCGHGHANKVMSFEGLPGVMGRANLRARNAGGGFNLVELRDGRMYVSEHINTEETKPPWFVVSLTNLPTNPSGPRPDFSVNSAYPGVFERWRWESGFTIANGPIVTTGLCIVGDASGAVTALSLDTGKPAWKFRTRGPVYAALDASDGVAVAASTDGSLYALRTEDGKRLWRFKTARPLVACPLIAGGVVYIGSSEGRFRALELCSGKLLWEFTGLTGFVETRPLMYDGKVVFGAWDQHLYAIDAATGKLAWKWKSDRPGVLYSPAACWPVGAEGKIFIAAPDRKITALDAKTGVEVWRSGRCEPRESLGLSEDQSRVFVRGMSNVVCAFATRATAAEKVWELNAGFGYDINSAMLVEKEGTLFYGTKNGLLLAIDSGTGVLKWQRKLGVALLNTVSPLNGRKVLVADFDGRVILVEATKL